MTATVSRFLSSPLPLEVESALSRLARASDVVHIAVMPDVHLAADVCVGTVVATRRCVIPAAVGGDIGCGVAALRFDAIATEVLGDVRVAAKVLAGFEHTLPRNRHRRADLPPWPEGLDPAQAPLSAPALTRVAHHEGRAQLGTLGSGNHFVELQRDDEDQLWLMLHSGSRSLGPAIRAHHQAQASVTDGGLAVLDVDAPEGRAYLSDLEWALRYANANRRHMVDAVMKVMGEVCGVRAVDGSYFACHHNHVRREVHGDETLWVHRKGAIAAAEGEPGLIPGSMGSSSFHVGTCPPGRTLTWLSS